MLAPKVDVSIVATDRPVFGRHEIFRNSCKSVIDVVDVDGYVGAMILQKMQGAAYLLAI